MSDRVETVRVVAEGRRLGYRVINKSSFVEGVHTLYVETPPSAGDVVTYPRDDQPVVDPRPVPPRGARVLGRRYT